MSCYKLEDSWPKSLFLLSYKILWKTQTNLLANTINALVTHSINIYEALCVEVLLGSADTTGQSPHSGRRLPGRNGQPASIFSQAPESLRAEESSLNPRPGLLGSGQGQDMALQAW